MGQVPLFDCENNNTDRLKEKFSQYYIGDLKFIVKRSKYSNELSTGIDDITSRKVLRLADNVDSHHLNDVEKKLEDKNRTLKSDESRVTAHMSTFKALEEAFTKLSNDVTALEKEKKIFKGKTQDLLYKKQLLKTLEQPSHNLHQEKEKIKVKKLQLVADLCKQATSLKDLTSEATKLDLQRRSAILQLHNVESANQDMCNSHAELNGELNKTEEKLRVCSQQFEKEKDDLKAAHNEATKSTNGVQDQTTKYKPPVEWQEKFRSLGTNDENVLTIMIEDYDADIKKKGSVRTLGAKFRDLERRWLMPVPKWHN